MIFKKGKIAEAEIIAWLRVAREKAYVPESGFGVSAVFRVKVYGADDYYFAGVNVENPDHRLSVHAEEACIAAMTTAFGKNAEIAEVWVMGGRRENPDMAAIPTCCGKCRQQIVGFASPDVKIHALSLSGKVSTTTVRDFLPDAFSFRQFIDLPAPSRGSAPADVEARLTRSGHLSEKDLFDWLKSLESVDYVSKTPSAFVLQFANGAYAAGCKVEDAAFLSISPMQAAIANAVTAFGMQELKAIWVYTKARALMLSEMQMLATVPHVEVEVNFFDENGVSRPGSP